MSVQPDLAFTPKVVGSCAPIELKAFKPLLFILKRMMSCSSERFMYQFFGGKCSSCSNNTMIILITVINSSMLLLFYLCSEFQKYNKDILMGVGNHCSRILVILQPITMKMKLLSNITVQTTKVMIFGWDTLERILGCHRFLLMKHYTHNCASSYITMTEVNRDGKCNVLSHLPMDLPEWDKTCCTVI